MIFGECPYCDEPVCFWVPDNVELPAFTQETCDSCGNVFWEEYSRIDPTAYTQEQFDERFVIDHRTREVVPIEQ